MSALSELRAGEVAEDFIGLLQRTVRAVARSREFPPPEGHDYWDANALQSTVAEFFAHSQTPRRLTDLATRCRTDDVLRRQLEVTVRNFLADIGRKTAVGRLVLRFNEVLKGDANFVRRDHDWAFAGSAARPGAVDLDALIAVASEIEVVVPAAWTKGDRNSPEIDSPSVVRLTTAVLDAAGGPLSASVLAQIAAKRLGLGSVPLSLDVTAFDPPTRISGSLDSTGDAAIRDSRAQQILEQLNDAERVSIGCLVPVEKLGPLLGVSGSKASLIRNRAITIVRSNLHGDEDRPALEGAIAELARSWTESWMNKTDPT
jgi:hypothetical protein